MSCRVTMNTSVDTQVAGRVTMNTSVDTQVTGRVTMNKPQWIHKVGSMLTTKGNLKGDTDAGQAIV